MIVYSGDFAYTELEVAYPNRPLIGHHNVVDISNITASSENVDFPATNLANPAMDLPWVGAVTADTSITLSMDPLDSFYADDVDIDYVGITGQNWFETGASVSLDLNPDGLGFYEAIPAFYPDDDRPLILRFVKGRYFGVRINLSGMSVPPRAAVMYAGALTVSPRAIYVGHTPITYGREPIVVEGVSQSGKYLGTIETGLTNKTSISFSNMRPDWYREHLDPIVESRGPFFWAWRPLTYPTETAFAWITGNPRPSNQRNSGGLMQISLQLEGAA